MQFTLESAVDERNHAPSGTSSMSDFCAHQYYQHIKSLGLSHDQPGLKLLLWKTYRAFSPDSAEKTEFDSSSIQLLNDVIKILHYCDEREQKYCLAAISSLLSNLSIELSVGEAINTPYYSILTNNRKLNLILSELAGVDKKGSFLRRNSTADNLASIIIDFCVHSCHQLLDEVRNELQFFNRQLAEDIIEYKKDNPDELYSADNREDIHKSSIDAVKVIIKKILGSRQKLPQSMCELLGEINEILIGNLGIEDADERFQILVGFYCDRFWSKLLQVNCVNFLAPEFAKIENGRYLARDFELDIVAAYNTLVCNVVKKIAHTDKSRLEVSTKYTNAQLKIISDSDYQEMLRNHIDALYRENYHQKLVNVAVDKESLRAFEIAPRLEKMILLRIKLSEAADFLRSTFFAVDVNELLEEKEDELLATPRYEAVKNLLDAIQSTMNNKFIKIDSSDYNNLQRARDLCEDICSKLAVLSPDQVSPEKSASGVSFETPRVSTIAQRSPNTEGSQEKRIIRKRGGSISDRSSLSSNTDITGSQLARRSHSFHVKQTSGTTNLRTRVSSSPRKKRLSPTSMRKSFKELGKRLTSTFGKKNNMKQSPLKTFGSDDSEEGEKDQKAEFSSSL